MRKLFCWTAAALLCTGLSSLMAVDEQSMSQTMKAIGGAAGRLKKSLDAKQGHEAAAEAEKITALYKEVAEFFEKRGTADAVTFAKNGITASEAIAAAGHNSDLDAAASNYSKVMGTCKSCHEAHREKVEGGYKIK